MEKKTIIRWEMVTNNKRIFYIEKRILPGRLSAIKWWNHCWLLLISRTGNWHQCPHLIHCPQPFTFTTQSKLSPIFDKHRGAFCPRLSFLFCFHKPIFKKPLYTFYFKNHTKDWHWNREDLLKLKKKIKFRRLG
jgi:hypothetical protein